MRAKAKQLFLFHHNPDHDDNKIDQMLEHARELVAEREAKLEVHAAREGLKVELGAKAK